MDGGLNTVHRATGQMAARRALPHEDVGDANEVAPMLVAVDMSEESRAALLWACEHAARIDVPLTALHVLHRDHKTRVDAPLVVLHVLHDSPEAPGKYARNAADPLTPMIDTAERMLCDFMAEVHTDHPELERLADARTKVVIGLPAQTIVDQAERLGAHSIVMGSRGRTGLPGLLYGSIAKRVVQLSPIPVTVVKDHQP